MQDAAEAARPCQVVALHPAMQLTWLQPFGLAVTGIQLTTVRPARGEAHGDLVARRGVLAPDRCVLRAALQHHVRVEELRQQLKAPTILL